MRRGLSEKQPENPAVKTLWKVATGTVLKPGRLATPPPQSCGFGLGPRYRLRQTLSQTDTVIFPLGTPTSLWS